MATGVPDELWLVESFLNSVDVESGQDDLESVARFQRWLGDHDRPAAGATASPADLELARELRTELRAIAYTHGHPVAGADPGAARLDVLAERVPLRAQFHGSGAGAGEVRLVPAATGVPGVLGEVLGAVVLADRGGGWRRLKLCREDTCQVVFYDRTKNGSRCWCSMEVCGNRNKTRAYRSRSRGRS